ncbi:MAG: TrmH family RNA methyltransferase [Candidatus Kapaibacterium sp.]
MIRISDIDDPRIGMFRSLKDLRRGDPSAPCIAEGFKVVRAAVLSGLPIHSVFTESSWLEEHGELFRSRGIVGDRLLIADRDVMTSIVGFAMHQGIMAAVLPPPPLDESDITFPCLVLNSISDSENVGALVRVACAFGWKNIVVDSSTVSPLVRRAVRVSMGTVFSIRIHEAAHLPALLHQLRHHAGARIIGAESTPGSIDVSGYAFPPRTVLVVGSEGHGIRPPVLEACDDVVRIPMDPRVSSLNVATAASVFCHAYTAQHGIASDGLP